MDISNVEKKIKIFITFLVQSCLFLNIKNQSIFEIIKFIIIGT